jgi:hypothetical protein
MARTYQVISADGLEIPPDAWVRHVEPAYRDQALRLVELPSGSQGRLVEGSPMVHDGQNVCPLTLDRMS